jgi:hypothetical protein
MKESEVREKMRSLKGDLLRLEIDEKTDLVSHAEIHRDNVLIWKWPEKSKTKLSASKWQQHGAEFKAFSLEKRVDGYEYETMGRRMEA